MIVLGYRAFPLSAFPADLPRPDGLSDAIDAAGLIHEPVVRESDGQIVCGHRRISAHRELKAAEVMCKVVEGSDDEVLLWRLQENSYRHDLSAAERAQAIRETFAVLRRIQGRTVAEAPPPPATENAGPPTQAKPVSARRGRPPKADKLLRDATAKALGVGDETVRRALDGESPAKRPGYVPPASPALAEVPKEEVPPPVAPLEMDTFGLELDAGWLTAVGAYNAALLDVHGRLTGAGTALGRLLGDIEAGTAAGPGRRVGRLREELRALIAKTTGARPTALCWYCKGADGVSEKCAACGGCGVGVRDQADGVPSELCDASHLRVSRGGEIVDMPGWEPAVEDDDPWPVAT